MAKLIVLKGEEKGKEIPLSDEIVKIGRAESTNLVLLDLNVSREHAQIKRDPNGFQLSDLDSANGTFVNGKRIDRVYLRDKDKIQIGKNLFLFEDEVSRKKLKEEKGKKVSIVEKYKEKVGLSIKLKFMVIITLTMVIISLFIFNILLTKERGVLTKQCLEKGIALVKYFASRNEEALKTENDLLFDVKSIMKNEAVGSAMIADPWGKILAHSNEKKVGISDKSLSLRGDEKGGKPSIIKYKRYKGWYRISLPIEGNSQILGTAAINFSTEEVEKILSETRSLGMFLTIGAILGGIMIAFVLSKIVLKPLNELNYATGVIATGNLDYKIKGAGSDELGRFIEKFNIMIKKIAQRIKEKEKITEREIAYERGKVESLIDVIPEGIILTDSNNNITHLNQSGERITGLSKEKVRGKHILEVLNEENFLSLMKNSLEQKNQTSSQEIDFKRRKVKVYIKAVTAESGELVSIITILQEKE